MCCWAPLSGSTATPTTVAPGGWATRAARLPAGLAGERVRKRPVQCGLHRGDRMPMREPNETNARGRKPWNFLHPERRLTHDPAKRAPREASLNIWPIESVVDSPEIALRPWQVFEVQLPQKPGRTRQFVGYSLQAQAGQVSSAIERFDPKTMRGVTASGRVYQLLGRPGCNADAEHTWRWWKSICGITGEVDVTGSMDSSRGNES